MPGAQCARSLVRARGSEVCARVFTAEAPETSGIPHAMVLTGYGALSPATNSSCHRRLTDCMASHIPVGLSVPPRDLTPTTGARTTRFDRPQQCRSSCTPLSIAHELPRPVTSCAHDTVASTASHPNVRDDRDTPLVDEDETIDSLKMIRVFWKAEYFFAGGMDRKSRSRVICPTRLSKYSARSRTCSRLLPYVGGAHCR